jgi:uncharacterized protein (DUF305 family)
MKQLVIGAALGLAVGVAGSGLAQQGTQQMPMNQGMQHGQTMQHGTTAAAGPAEKAYRAANAKMHKMMAIKYTGDADKDFVASMIPHHQGAIDMAEVELKYGKDPEVRKVAETIVRDQTREIAELKAWQAKAK